MLGYIRESIQGWIAWAIIGLLIIPFALWGINEYFGNDGPLVVANVNGEKISSQSLQTAFFNQRDRMRQMLGGRYDPDMWDKQLKQQALDSLVEQELLFQNASASDFGLASENVRQYIRNIEAFQQEGKFSQERYIQTLKANGQNPAEFEQQIKRSLVTQQVYSAFNATAFVTPQEVETIQKLQEQVRTIDYLVVPVTNYKKPDVVTDAAIQATYDQHNDSYMTDELVSIQYVELDAAKLSPALDKIPSDEELQQYFQEREAQYKVPEERKSSHILISVAEGADEKTIEAARTKALNAKARLDKGEAFATLATELSDDPGSKKLGGDIGFFGKNALDPNYEKQMFAMKVGEVSEPVLSAFGFHIIKLTDVKSEQAKSFSEVRGDILAEFTRAAADKKYYELSDKLTTLAYEVSTTLDDAAGAVGLPLQSSELFTRKGGQGITANPKVAAAAFGSEVLGKGFNSEPIELGENHIIVLRVKDHQPAALKPLAAVKDQISNELIAAEAKKQAKLVGQALQVKLATDSADSARKAIADELKVEWKNGEVLKRGDNKVDVTIINAVFKTKRPEAISEANKVTAGGVALANGDYAVFLLTKVEDGKLDGLEKDKQTALKRNLAGIEGSSLFEQYSADLKEAANIAILNDNL